MNGTEEKNERFTRLTQTPVPKLVLKLAVPTTISMLVTGIYSTADTFFVGRISTQATAAVGLAFSVMAVMQALGFMCGHGSGNFLSRRLGAGNHKEADEMAATGFAAAILIGLAVAIAGNMYLEPLCRLIGATETTMADAQSYLRIILCGAPFLTGQFVINNQLRFQGSAMYAMAGLLAGAALNIVLDPLLIFGFHMGTAGAAAATVCGQAISFVVLLYCCYKGENIHLRIRNVHLNPYYVGSMLGGGLPSLFRQGLAAVATMLLNKAAGAAGGDAAIAGMSVVTRILMLTSSAMIGFGQGYQPVCSFNYGARLYKRVKEGYFFCMKVGTTFLVLMALLCITNSELIIGVFRDDSEVIRIGSEALRWQAAALPLLCPIVMTNMMLQSMGKGFKASITSSARNGIFFIPLIIVLPRIFGLTGVEITQAVADVLSFFLAMPIAWSEVRKMK